MLQFGGINFVEEQWDIIWGSPCDFEECSNRNRMKSNITKCIRVYLGTNNCHKLQQQKWDETSHCESKDSKLFLLWRLSADKNWGEGSLIYIYIRWLGMPTRCIIQKRREREEKQISYFASQDRQHHFHDIPLQYHLEQVSIVLIIYILKSEVKTDG